VLRTTVGIQTRHVLLSGHHESAGLVIADSECRMFVYDCFKVVNWHISREL
jgi:hypothetical protein